MNRRALLQTSLAAAVSRTFANEIRPSTAEERGTLPQGKIGDLKLSRMILGGNLLTHFTHSRDLKYVYNLTAHYNTDEKIMETLALAEANGINTVSMHNPPRPMSVLRKYRSQGGKIQWIICPTAKVTADMEEYKTQVRELIQEGCEAIYLWGVHSDKLIADGKIDLIAKAVEVAKEEGVPSGVGAHDLRVIAECEKNNIPADFYIKTFHHHNYPSGPKPAQIQAPYSENPGYWCSDPNGVIDLMKTVTKPWFAFKVMAAGAIPPKDAFRYAFENGADHILVGMFDFEIQEDVELLKSILPTLTRTRPWRS
jgi:hypothetical protein